MRLFSFLFLEKANAAVIVYVLQFLFANAQ